MTKGLSFFLFFIAIILAIATLLPILPFEIWFVRVFDFPRVQILILSLLVLILLILYFRGRRVGQIFIALLFLASVYQAIKIWPYTPFASVQAHPAGSNVDPETQLKLLVSNVYMENTHYEDFIQLIKKENPDLFLTLESDKKWQDALIKLSDSYPHQVLVPKDNTYGMHLYSKLPLHDTEVKYWLDKEIPSIHTFVTLPSGVVVEFYGIHPKPPVPTEEEDSKKRDAEIMIVGNRVADSEYPVIVAGDLNDVAWSPITRLFLESSGLLDPRLGRGFYNTFNANNILFRWPLDHFFYSTHFRLIKIERLPDIKSDHFPIAIHLNYAPLEENSQEKVDPDEDTKDEETQTIEEGIEDARKN